MTTTTMSWMESLAGELAAEADATRERQEGERRETAEARRALAAGIRTWWARFLAAWHEAVESLHRAPGLAELRLIERQVGVVRFQRGELDFVEAALAEDGALQVRTLIAGSGGTRWVELRAAAGGIAPPPETLAQEILEPFARAASRWAQRRSA